jgi:hypothetical protein
MAKKQQAIMIETRDQADMALQRTGQTSAIRCRRGERRER